MIKNCLELSRQRYTTKHYDPNKKVPVEQIKTLMEILRNTPSSLNVQPWHFVIIDNHKSQDKILPAIADFNYSRIVDSSHTIVFCIKSPLTKADIIRINEKESEDGRYSDQAMKQERLEHLLGGVFNGKANAAEGLESWEKHQLYIALGQLLYATEQMNIDSTAIGGFNATKLDQILGLEAKGLKSEVLITLGYRAANDGNATRPKSRLNENELFTFWE